MVFFSFQVGPGSELCTISSHELCVCSARLWRRLYIQLLSTGVCSDAHVRKNSPRPTKSELSWLHDVFFLYGTLKACARTLFIRCGLPVCKCTCISDVNKLASLASVFCFSSCVAVASHHHLSTELTARRWVDYNLQRAGFQVYRSPGRITGRCAHDVPLLDLRL